MFRAPTRSDGVPVLPLEELLPPPPAKLAGRALLVEPERLLQGAYARALREAGLEVTTAGDAAGARRALDGPPFDVVVSDVDLPGLEGIPLLREARRRDLDLPVIMLTSGPSVRAAAKALELGAMRYLVKPFGLDALVRSARHAVHLRKMAELKRLALEQLGAGWRMAADRARQEESFRRALGTLWIAWQPIVRWSQRAVIGHEALLRSRDPGLPDAGAVLEATRAVDGAVALGRRVRELVDDTTPPPEGLLFVNVHPRELEDDSLADPRGPLGRRAQSCVLEIAERASLAEIKDARRRIEQLREAGFRIAADDLGPGQDGLAAIAELEPELVKLDRALVRELDSCPKRQRLVGGLVDLCTRMGIQVIAEGVETAAERDALADAGCDLMQGYLFAHPAAPAPPPRW